MAQNDLNVNILANVKGAEQIATLINRVGSLEKETQRLRTANEGLSNSTNAVIRNGVRYNNAMDAQSRALRQNRQGVQQLGMQINDFATSVSTGASPIQAFNQQLGQVGFAMSQMGGIAGRIGSFLAGPWGAAIVIGTMALGPLIDKLFQSKKAAEEAARAHSQYLNAVAAGNSAELIKAQIDLTKMQEKRMKLDLQLENAPLPSGSARFGAVPGERGRIQAQMGQIDADIRWMQLAVDRGQAARDALSKAQRAAPRQIGGGGSSARAGGGSRSAVKQELFDMAKYMEGKRSEWAAEDEKFWMSQSDNFARHTIENSGKLQDQLSILSQMNRDAFIKPIDDALDNLAQSYQAIGNTVSDAFKGMLTGASSWKDGMKGIINSVIDQLWRLYVVQSIVGMISKGLGAIGLPLPGFANGTNNAPGGLAIVGERGPELVNLPKGSQVIPSHRSKGMMGGGMTVNVDARGSSDPAAVRAQVQQGILEAAPAIIAAAQQRTMQGMRRPRLGGAMQ
jgi:phage-related tail protein